MIVDIYPTGDRQGSADLKGFRTQYSDSYIVLTDSFSDNQPAVLTAVAIYLNGFKTGERGDTNAILQRIRCQQLQKGESAKWLAIAEYDSDPLDDPSFQTSDPTAMAPRISISYEKYNVESPTDVNSQPCLNSSRQPIIGGATLEYAMAKVKIEQNVLGTNSVLDWLTFMGALYCTNNADWNGYPMDAWLFDSLDLTLEYQNQIQFWKCHFGLTLRLDPDFDPDVGVLPGKLFYGHQGRFLDQGWEEYNDVDNTWAKIIDVRTGQVITSPALLKDGKKLDPNFDQPVWLFRQTRRRIDFKKFFPGV